MKQHTFLEALILAHNAGPEYRACADAFNVNDAGCRARWIGGTGWANDAGGGRHDLSDLPARIYRPAQREASLIEALHWASQDESRTFEHEGHIHRVHNGGLQFRGRELDWRDTDASGWQSPCTIDEGWEEVELEVTPK